MPMSSPPLSPAQSAALSSTFRFINSSVPAGNTVIAQTETPFASKASLPGNALGLGARLSLLLFGLYTSSGVTPAITPRVRLGGVELFPTRSITGLLASTGIPWSARSDFVVTDSGIVGTGLLVIDDNQVRRFGGPPVTGIDLTQALDLTASATWGQASCSITLQGFIAEIVRATQ